MMRFQSFFAYTSCPTGWVKWRRSCYILLPDKMNWIKADEACSQLRSQLIVPNSRQENDFIFQSMGGNGIWIGCTDAAQEGVWLCGGQPASFTYWYPGNPHNDSLFNCARMTVYGGKWSDSMECDKHHPKLAACEMDVSTVPVYHTMTGPDGRVSQQCLLHHDINNLAVEGVIACGRACTSDPQCHSFNVWQSSKKEKKCQLNDVTRLEADHTDFKVTDGCYYFDL